MTINKSYLTGSLGAGTSGELAEPPAPNGRRSRRRARGQRGRDWIGYIALAVFVLLLLTAFIGPLVAGNPFTQGLADKLLPPGSTGKHGVFYPLGSDDLGRNLLARVVVGLRTSILLCGAATILAMLVGSLVGTLSGYLRGAFDDIVMRLIDVLLALPGIVTIMMVITLLGASVTTIILVLAMLSSVVFARVARSEVISLREQDLIPAIRSLGATGSRIVFRHVLPTILGSLTVVATLEFATLIVVEAALDYLGLGIQQPQPTLGNMIAGGQGAVTAGIWWPVVVPGAAITLLIMSVNILGDWVRDILDPRAAGRS
jgi:peptide/nickel transport system permease protein